MRKLLQEYVATLLFVHRAEVLRELQTISKGVADTVIDRSGVLRAMRERIRTTPVSVLVIGNYAVKQNELGPPCCLAWSGELRANEKRTVWIQPYRNIGAGAYLVCLSGGFLSDVRIGDMCVGAQMAYADGIGLTPLMQLETVVQVGSRIGFTVQLHAEST